MIFRNLLESKKKDQPESLRAIKKVLFWYHLKTVSTRKNDVFQTWEKNCKNCKENSKRKKLK